MIADLKQDLSTRRAFSLLELLVAIGLIIVLAGMLIPSMRRAMEKMDQVSCSNNLRQLHQYLMLYANEHDGVFPAASDATTGYSWWLSLQTYINQPSQAVAVGKKTIFACPSATKTYPGGRVRRTYAMNYEGLSDWRMPIRPMLTSAPGQTILIVDSACANSEGDGSQFFRVTSTPSMTGVAEARHTGKVNCLFLDGHVGLMLPSDPDMAACAKNLGK